jgi:hypothetical protein
MLDGKRYYAAFPDEDPELQLRLTAVLQALGKVEKAFRKPWNHFRPKSSKATRRVRHQSLLNERARCHRRRSLSRFQQD